MDRISKLGVTLLILISVILLCCSVALYIIKENEIDKRKSFERQLNEMTEEKKKIAIELEELKKAKVDVELELALNEKELQNYRQNFDLIKIERGLLETEKSTLAERLAYIQQDLSIVKKDYERLQQAKEVLEQKLKDIIDSNVKLKTIIVEPEEVSKATEGTGEIKAAKKTIEGEVLAVNKEYEFLVINLGLKNGLTENSKISVYRDSELIAEAQIEKLYENISAVVVRNTNQLSNVKVGDVAIATVEGQVGQ